MPEWVAALQISAPQREFMDACAVGFSKNLEPTHGTLFLQKIKEKKEREREKGKVYELTGSRWQTLDHV